MKKAHSYNQLLLRIVICIVIWVPSASHCDEAVAVESENPAAGVTAVELDRAMDEVIARPEYAWRLPREVTVDEDTEQGVLASFVADLAEQMEKAVQWVWKRLERLIDWLSERLDRDRPLPQSSFGWQTPIQTLLFVLLAVTLSTLAILLLRLWRTRKHTDTVTATPMPPSAQMLHDEAPADALPSTEWLALARDMFSRGELRLGLRAMFLSCLAHLAESDIVGIAVHKSNREYVREVERRAHDIEGMLPAFTSNVRIIEEVWYGDHYPTDDMVSSFEMNHERILMPGAPSEAPPVPAAGDITPERTDAEAPSLNETENREE